MTEFEPAPGPAGQHRVELLDELNLVLEGEQLRVEARVCRDLAPERRVAHQHGAPMRQALDRWQAEPLDEGWEHDRARRRDQRLQLRVRYRPARHDAQVHRSRSVPAQAHKILERESGAEQRRRGLHRLVVVVVADDQHVLAWHWVGLPALPVFLR